MSMFVPKSCNPNDYECQTAQLLAVIRRIAFQAKGGDERVKTQKVINAKFVFELWETIVARLLQQNLLEPSIVSNDRVIMLQAINAIMH